MAPKPNPGSGAGDTVYLNRLQLFKSGTADSASNIRMVILNNLFADLTGLNTSSASVVGLSTNTLSSTASLFKGNPTTFSFNDLALTFGNNYAAVFVNVGSGGELTPVRVSSLTANYVDIGGGNYHPQTNYGTESGSYWNYATSDFHHTDMFGTYFDVYSWGGDANFAATLTTTPAPKWNIPGSGDWNNASNWINGVPNAAGDPAIFGSAAGGAVTVNTNVNVQAGTIRFDNANSYTIGGSNAVTLDVTSGWAWAGVNAGNHSISAPLALADNTEFSVAAGSTLTVSNLQPSAVLLLKTGGGTLKVNNVRTSALMVSTGTVQVLPSSLAAGTSRVATVSIAAGAKLDLADNKLIVTTAGEIGSWNGSNYTGITGLVASGRGDGTWNGNGIATSMTDATGGTGYTMLGVATGSEARGIGPTDTDTWGGQTVPVLTLWVMYTYGGDANLSGNVDVDDYGQIDFNASTGGVLKGWFNGDFDYNGTQDVDDYGIIDFVINIQGPAFYTGGGAGLTAVPEPAGVSMIAAGAGLLALRRRRR